MSACCRVTRQQMDRYLTSVPRQETQAGPRERLVLFIRGWWNKSKLQATSHLLVPLSLSPAPHCGFFNSLNRLYRISASPRCLDEHRPKRPLAYSRDGQDFRGWKPLCLTWGHERREGGMQVSVAVVLIRAALQSSPRTCIPRVLSHTHTNKWAACIPTLVTLMKTQKRWIFTVTFIPNETILPSATFLSWLNRSDINSSCKGAAVSRGKLIKT